jgi:decaprenylphospho-beta-D-ribofuranose 2-oxidase
MNVRVTMPERASRVSSPYPSGEAPPSDDGTRERCARKVAGDTACAHTLQDFGTMQFDTPSVAGASPYAPADDRCAPPTAVMESGASDVPIRPLSSWSRYPIVLARQRVSESLEAITGSAELSRGLGRSYGDASLPSAAGGLVACSVLADRFLSFDEATGLMRAEAGVSLAEIYRLFLPRNWFVPVTPGTKFVTLGGAVASDVHGKNHHREGCFGQHVTNLRVRIADGRIIDCSPERHSDLFYATIGGMGLTGHVIEVEFLMARIASPWIYEERERIANIEMFVERLEQNAAQWPFTVGWIDCLARGKALGRGILIMGRWAEPHEAPPKLPPLRRTVRVPFDLPSWVLNAFSMKVANAVYYRTQARTRADHIIDPHVFFYPLDAVRDWNRLYGRRGFTQHQCVIPRAAGVRGVRRLVEAIAAERQTSCLCVIKDCGAEGKGMLSFPKLGISVALDLPLRPSTEALVARLNTIVIEEGGRIYLAKDALTRREHFEAMEPRLAAWRSVQRKWDPTGKLCSSLAARLLGEHQE